MAEVQGDRKWMFEYRNIDWDEDTVVQNTWYDPMPLTEDVKVYYIRIEQTNNGAAVEAIEVELIIDGTVYPLAIAALPSATPQLVILNWDGGLNATVAGTQVLARDPDHSAPLETRSLRIRIRQTSPVDPVAALLEVNVVYEELLET